MLKGNFFATATLALFLLTVVNPGSAQSAFSFTDKVPAPETPETGLDLTGDDSIVLAQIGSGHVEKKQSRGDNVLLPLAIELIAPDGWGAVVSEDFEDKKVSWRSESDGDWVKTLESIGEKEGLRFVLNWKAKEVAAGEKRIEELTEELQQAEESELTEENEIGVTHLEAEPTDIADSETGEQAVNISEEPWKLSPGSLKEQLTKWAKRADYTLIWDNRYDYQLDAGQTFYGGFTKAVNGVITALYNNGARIKADIYTKNNVLYITGGSNK